MPQERNYQHQEPAPRQPAKKRRKKRGFLASLGFILVYVLFVISTSAILACAGWIAANDVLALNKDSHQVTLTITPEDDFEDIVDMLKDNGLIEYKFLFKLFSTITHGEEKISRSGTFSLNTDMDYRALISGISANSATRARITVAIPEGYTIDQIFRLLEEKGVATVDDLKETAARHDYNFSFLKSIPLGDYKRLEGYLYPDTYEFYTPHDPIYALNKLLVRFDSQFNDRLRQTVADKGYTMHEILTIASLIEKETDGTDRARIASVIYNRLNNPSAGTAGYLQIDATLAYINGGHIPTEADKSIDSPYNTYLYQGLPPAPIANPGMASINAAINPANEKYYYYALGDDGVHHYFQSYDGLTKFINSQELYKNT